MTLEDLEKDIALDPKLFPLKKLAVNGTGEVEFPPRWEPCPAKETLRPVGELNEGELREAADTPGASSSGGPAGLGSADPLSEPAVLAPPETPREDYWIETEAHWIRFHVVPRMTLCYPADGLGGPSLESIKPVRVTMLVYLDGKRETKEHAWDDPHWSKAKTRRK